MGCAIFASNRENGSNLRGNCFNIINMVKMLRVKGRCINGIKGFFIPLKIFVGLNICRMCLPIITVSVPIEELRGSLKQ